MTTERRKAKIEWDVPAVLALIFIMGFFANLMAMQLWAIPEDNVNIITTMMTNVTTIMTVIASFYYGYSKGAQTAQQASDVRKANTDVVLQDIAKNSAPVAAAAAAAATTGAPVTIIAPGSVSTAETGSQQPIDMNVTADNVVVKEQPKA